MTNRKMTNRYWLVYYTMMSDNHRQELRANGVINMFPADFLIELFQEFPQSKPVLISSMEITKEHYEKLEDLL